MTNFEKYQKEIKEIIDANDNVALINGKPVECASVENCKYCDFAKKINSCMWHVMKWACEEYIEPQINLPEDIKVDTPILVSDNGETWHKRYFARFMPSGVYVGAWNDGKTSWTTNGGYDVIAWRYAKLPEE